MNKKTFQAKSGYIHRSVAGADVLISVGENIADFNGYIELNPSAAFLWDQLKEARTLDQLISALTENFEVSPARAQEDTEAFLAELQSHSMVTVR